jgi:hypothetical protein
VCVVDVALIIGLSVEEYDMKQKPLTEQGLATTEY